MHPKPRTNDARVSARSCWNPLAPPRRCLAGLVLLLSVPLIAACGGTGPPGEGPEDGEGSSEPQPLESREIVHGEDGTILGATEGALDTATDVVVEATDVEAATDAPLPVERMGDAYRFTSDRRVDTGTDEPFVVGISVDATCPECGEGPVEDLAIAMLLPGEEGHGDPFPGFEHEGHGGHEDRWAYRQAFYDEEQGLLLTTLHSLTEEGRVMAVVRDEDFQTEESRLPPEGETELATAQSDPTFEMRCHPDDFDDVSYSCGQIDRDAAAELFEKAYDDYTSVGYTDSPNLYKVPESVAIDNDEPWAQEGAYVMTLRACDVATSDDDVGDPGHYWGSNGPGSVYACFGANVNWKKTPDPPPARWVEDIIRHETFHGMQSDYLSNLGPAWVTEGTAQAAQESLAFMEVSRQGDSAKGPGARHAVDVPLDATTNDEHYKAEDFWVWLGKRLNQSRPVGDEEGLEYLIPFFENGTGLGDIDTQLETTGPYSGPGFSGLSAAYLDWVRNQAFEKHIQLGPDTLGDFCSYNGTFVNELLTMEYEPDEAPPAAETFTLDPLDSKVVRFDFGEFVLGPYQALASIDSGDTAVKIKFFDDADDGTVACHGSGGTSEVGSQLVQHQARDGSHRHYALVSNTDLSQSHDVTASVGGNDTSVEIIAPGDGHEYDEGDQVFLEAVGVGFDDYGEDFEIEWSYEDGQGTTQTVATTDNRESVQVQLPCIDSALTAEASNDDQSASAFVDVTCTPAQETFLFNMVLDKSGEVDDAGSVDIDPTASDGVLAVGDTEGGRAIRSYLTFPLHTLPDGLSSIDAAELTVFVGSISGSPFDELGALTADHAEYGALDAGDYPVSNLRPGGGVTLSESADHTGNITVDVTAAVQNAWSQRSSDGEDVQFVLRPASRDSNGDTLDDLYLITAEERSDGSLVVPTLSVEFSN